ncbi:hypothetical protein MASR2M36_00260 [Providencia sp.]
MELTPVSITGYSYIQLASLYFYILGHLYKSHQLIDKNSLSFTPPSFSCAIQLAIPPNSV